MKYLITFISVSLLCDAATDFKWNNKEEIETWFNDIAVSVSTFLRGDPGENAAKQFADALNPSDDFEEYLTDHTIVGRSNWLEHVKGIPTLVNSFEAFYDIDLWEERQVATSFVYIWNFIDDSKMTSRGKLTAVWNKNGEVSRWIYFGKSGSTKAVSDKFGELKDIQSKKQDL
eukprot:UN06222